MNQSCDSRSLVPGDDRLLVFRALDNGLSSGVIQAGFICREKAVLEGMSFVFARRYYTLVHETCLRQASQCVLGIVNLGLSERSGGRLSVAADLLTSRGSLGMFREGWTRVLKLVRAAGHAAPHRFKTDYELEREFAEDFTAVPGRPWCGRNHYAATMLKLYYMKTRSREESGR